MESVPIESRSLSASFFGCVFPSYFPIYEKFSFKSLFALGPNFIIVI